MSSDDFTAHADSNADWLIGPSPDAKTTEERVRALSADQTLDRYHELVDRRLKRTLTYKESLELDLIEARLDAEDQSEVDRLALQEDRRRERNELVASIEELLARIKTR